MFQSISDQAGGIRLQFSGAIEGANAEALRAALVDVVAQPGGPVVLDFSGMTLIDGSGVGAVAFLFKRLHTQGRSLSIVGAGGQPLALLRELGIAALLGAGLETRLRPLSARGAWARAWLMTRGRLTVG